MSGWCRTGRMCGIGPVGEVLHIRPRPAGGGSAESCGNVPAFNTVEILPCAEGSALHMGDRPLKTDVLGRVAESCGKHGIRLHGRPFRMCSTPATGPRRPCTVREGPRREAGPPGSRGRGRWSAPLKPGSGPPRPPPRAGRRPVTTCRTLFPKVVASRWRPRPVVTRGTSSTTVPTSGRAGGRLGHADRGADAQESVMLVTESFRCLPRGTRRKPPSALVAKGLATTTCCGHDVV